MRLPLPGPSDVIGAALQVRDGVTGAAEGLTAALELVPRAALLVDRAAALLRRVERVVDEVEATSARAAVAVAAVEQTLRDGDQAVRDTDALIARAGLAAQGAERLVEVTGTVVAKADRAVAGATGVLDRTDALVSQVEPLARQLMPAAQRFAEQLSPQEVDAAIALVDRLPTVLDHLDQDVLPMLRQLDRVGPDVHEILEVVQDLRVAITGLPGVGLLKRRGERLQDDDDAEDGDDERVASA